MPEEDVVTTQTEGATTAGDIASPQTAPTTAPPVGSVAPGVQRGTSIADIEAAGAEDPTAMDDSGKPVEMPYAAVPAPGHPLLHPTGPSPGSRVFAMFVRQHPAINTPAKMNAMEKVVAMFEMMPAEIENDTASIDMHIKDYFRRI